MNLEFSQSHVLVAGGATPDSFWRDETRRNPSVPAHAKEVYDVTSVSDTVIAALATELARGLNVGETIHLSSLAAGIDVGCVGTANVGVDDLRKHSKRDSVSLSSLGKKLKEQRSLISELSQRKSQDQEIVFANVCLDLLYSSLTSCNIWRKTLNLAMFWLFSSFKMIRSE